MSNSLNYPINSLDNTLIPRITHRLFDRAVMQNNIRSIYVEHMVEALLGEGWALTSGDWASWDLAGPDGVRAEIKQAAARQSWHREGARLSSPRFDIAARTGRYEDGETWIAEPGRPAHLYIFAWHDVADETCDQRAPEQWRFYLAREADLPAQKSISLGRLAKIAKQVDAGNLRNAVNLIAC